MPRSIWRILSLAVLVSAIGVAPSACGKRGKLEAPSGNNDLYPRQYPKQDEPTASATSQSSAAAASQQAPGQQAPGQPSAQQSPPPGAPQQPMNP